ncbi:piggyBac transposable element-derived protein 4-like isoform X1 [Myxocyprinus asiaticus]|uniref:piggyBac transposable element-derived protein 4-like isoform X1 n=1 Tax=Myxocyprinus asiaticus TaxID=70543 RepID=UPI002223BE5E|nr:piggyBac transposable element-derived protein 4-like isoform X1 [Myxocyprinus asiaticus]XP_051559284.1 piggyBac transposable element-derived protein 4-like isoform X1 [Myxocyprinus asiaticus]
MDPKKDTNGVEEVTGSSDEDLNISDEESVDTTTEDMFIDGLDPVLDRPSTDIDSLEEDWDSDASLQQRKRSRLSSTSVAPAAEGSGDSLTDVFSGVSKESWHSTDEDDVEPPLPVFSPVQTPGPKRLPKSCSSPLQFFELFFSKFLMQKIVGHTNVYGTKCKDRKREIWHYICVNDLKSFIAMVIYMGLVKCSSLKDYWRESEYFSLSFPAQIMSYQKFQTISSALHLSNTKEDERNDLKRGTSAYERLGKIQSLYQIIRDVCKIYFHPFQNITIDERVVAAQARTRLKQCMKNQSTDRGYKLFVLADCSSGYIWDFFVYEGKSSASQSEGLSYESVMALVDENMLGTGYKLFVDKFYTSPTLFRDLLCKDIWACGPIWANRKGFPKNTVNRLPWNTPRGSIRWIRDNELLFVEWKDAREVQMCSTYHKAYGGDTVQRKVKGKDGHRTLVDVPIPAAVLDYNRNMGAVDPPSRITGHYRVLHKPRKWYQSIFYHFLDIAIDNAFILQELMAKAKNQKALTRKAFLETLILELTDSQKKANSTPKSADSVPSASSSDPLSDLLLTTPSAPSLTLLSAPSWTPPPLAPALALYHRPQHISQDATTGRRKCKLCHLKTPVICFTCDVALCFQPKRDCFNDWHERSTIFD